LFSAFTVNEEQLCELLAQSGYMDKGADDEQVHEHQGREHSMLSLLTNLRHKALCVFKRVGGHSSATARLGLGLRSRT
jgi:hypothetical protein